ncbi:hypothetical protein HHL16_01615 [Pseudoflavitalea sp. G-6-1-2]|uniref:hypothetical protein n=1 Tax=Pseudoflavitalea sp. G-6-1-2 TaxID=2728841 RepID=UPI00146C1994|nr:hypothetical protein [Pseudoflavitalea sp. G-6-1-2]NML19546.1 hypothetical protein [Pseudoflavitalea sp. G-6-1-2]
MMRRILFIVILFSLLFRGDDLVYIGIHHHPICYVSAQGNEKKQLAVAAKQEASLNKGNTSGAADFLIIEDLEDEDSVNAFARKSRLLANYSHLLSRYTIPDDDPGSYWEHQPTDHYSSYRYILQRTLRI